MKKMLLIMALAVSSQSYAWFWSSTSTPTYTMNDIGKKISIPSIDLNCSESNLRSNDMQKIGLSANISIEGIQVSCQELSEEFEKHSHEWNLTIREVSPLQERQGDIYDCKTSTYYYRTCTEDRITYQTVSVSFQVNGKLFHADIYNNIKIESGRYTRDLL